MDAKPAAFNARGFVFVSVNYRLIPEVNASQQMQDVARAVAWVKQNIGQYGGVPVVILPSSEKTHGQLNREFGLPNDRVSSVVFDWLEKILQSL